MKKLLTWGAVGLLTSALLDPIIYATLEQPIPWLRDLVLHGRDRYSGFTGCCHQSGTHSTCLIGQPLARDIERLIGCPVRVRNDADCFTLA